ncbi:hypothetical protein DL767_006753 [Monosporascus sp. MG133]|nr:hypothetical protein DL767_006753 [Monosporascus sp. MG133]
MEDIYSRARGVVAYLGRPKDGIYGFQPGEKLGDSYDPSITDEYDIVRRLWAQPWFTRAWIIQEAVLSSSIVVLFGEGDHHATGDFDHTAKLAERTLDGPPGQLQPVAGKGTGLFGGGFKRRLFWCLVEIRLEYGVRELPATDPKDKVYGLMGMLRSNDREAITKVPNLPPWAPDWSFEQRHPDEIGNHTVSPGISINSIGTELTVRESIIDQVLLVSDPCGYGPNEPPVLTKPDTKDTNTAIVVWTREALSLHDTLLAKNPRVHVPAAGSFTSATPWREVDGGPQHEERSSENRRRCIKTKPTFIWAET